LACYLICNDSVLPLLASILASFVAQKIMQSVILKSYFLGMSTWQINYLAETKTTSMDGIARENNHNALEDV